MTRRPAIITQADVARALRAAKQAGATGVEIKPDGTIFVRISPEMPPNDEATPIDRQRRIVL